MLFMSVALVLAQSLLINMLAQVRGLVERLVSCETILELEQSHHDSSVSTILLKAL